MVEMEVEVTVEMEVGEMEEMVTGTETAEMVVELMEMETMVLKKEQKMLVLV